MASLRGGVVVGGSLASSFRSGAVVPGELDGAVGDGATGVVADGSGADPLPLGDDGAVSGATDFGRVVRSAGLVVVVVTVVVVVVAMAVVGIVVGAVASEESADVDGLLAPAKTNAVVIIAPNSAMIGALRPMPRRIGEAGRGGAVTLSPV